MKQDKGRVEKKEEILYRRFRRVDIQYIYMHTYIYMYTVERDGRLK